MASVKLRLNKGAKDGEGRFALVFQVLHEGKKKLVHTGYRLKESEFDAKAERILPDDEGGLSKQKAGSMRRHLNKKKKRVYASD